MVQVAKTICRVLLAILLTLLLLVVVLPVRFIITAVWRIVAPKHLASTISDRSAIAACANAPITPMDSVDSYSIAITDRICTLTMCPPRIANGIALRVGEAVHIYINHAAATLPKHMVNALIQHEIGHIHHGHRVTKKDMVLRALGIGAHVLRMELEADAYAVQHTSAHDVLSLLHHMSEVVITKAQANEIAKRIKAITHGKEDTMSNGDALHGFFDMTKEANALRDEVLKAVGKDLTYELSVAMTNLVKAARISIFAYDTAKEEVRTELNNIKRESLYGNPVLTDDEFDDAHDQYLSDSMDDRYYD